MTREDHLKFCKLCLNRKFNPKLGLVCSLTDKIADFENECEHFERDESVKEKIEDVEERSTTEILSELSDETKEKLRYYQDLSYSIIGGFFVSMICAVIWAAITVSMEYQIAYMAIGVGLVVGLAVRYLGAGIDPIFGFIGALYALLGCLLGNLFSQIGFFAEAQGMDYFSVMMLLNAESIIDIYLDTFGPMDLIFYGIAIFEGYKFAFRHIPSNVNELEDLKPANSNMRLPLVMVCFILISFLSYNLSKGISGEQTFYYESGKLLSNGEFVNGVENGEWMYFYENGVPQAIANYDNGRAKGTWQWFDENGNKAKQGDYLNGLAHGLWMNYHENGNLRDSTNYSSGRLNGEYKSYYENTQLSQSGLYKRDRQEGNWRTFHENGTKSSEGVCKNGEMSNLWKFWSDDGKLTQELNYKDKNQFEIISSWDINGNQIVINGNGSFESYYPNKKLAYFGKLVGRKKIGVWKTLFQNGNLKEEGMFEGDKYRVINLWSLEGEQLIKNANGDYLTHFEDSNKLAEKGNIVDGLKNGIWKIYHLNSIVMQDESNYNMGKLEGRHMTYYQNGNIAVEGDFIEDKKDGTWNWYYESGSLQCSVGYLNDKKNGSQIFYSESGFEAKEEVYENGELISETML